MLGYFSFVVVVFVNRAAYRLQQKMSNPLKLICSSKHIYSFGEEGMQLVQPSKFFSVTIFRIHSIGRLAWEWALLLF